MTEEEQKIADAEALAAKELAEKEAKEQDAKNADGSEEKTLEQKNKELYARTKKAEDEAKKLKEDMKKLLEVQPNEETKDIKDEPKVQDPLEIVKLATALKDYSEEQLEYIKLIAKAKNVPILEAIGLDEVITYVSAKREKDKQDNLSQIPGGKYKKDEKKHPIVDKFNESLSPRFRPK
jgi:hypothetical protein